MDTDKKIDFGDYAVVDPLEHYFTMAPDTYWRIKPITMGMELARSKFMMHNRVIEGPLGDRIEMPPTNMEIVFRELALTFGGTNLAYEDGSLVLEEGASIEQIEAVLAS